ncbi:MAG: ABC transporter permease subunit [Planctomycetes bacterium]|nr:ABC transporter permease subunit [Planctomycetota bacterium]
MNQVLSKIWLWFWHLLPANPILVRVVHGASRRTRHLYLRFGYLAALLVVVLISLFSAMSGQNTSLTELAKGASTTFMWGSYAQLALMCFLAPVFTAAAITQERDAQTFDILLSTPLTNGQIVFGSLMSRLFFVIMLLLAGLPIFLMTMVYGGVTTAQVFESFAISGATAIVTGALAITISMIRVGTRRTIFSFYLMIALYLIGVYMLGMHPSTAVGESRPNVSGQQMSWLSPLHPFLALDVALNRVHAPDVGQLAGRSAILRYALAYPSRAYVAWTLGAAFLMTVFSMIFVRRGAKTGESTFLSRLAAKVKLRAEPGERTRTPQHVWKNPVAWREAKTTGSNRDLFRWAIVIAGLVGSAILFVTHVQGRVNADGARNTLAAIIMVQFAIALLIATNTAATSMTREKESKTMDLLLTTLLTSKYVLWGKLRGLVVYCLPLVAGPVLALLVFGGYGLFGSSRFPAVSIETCVEIGSLMVVYIAFACVIGLKTSLHSKKTVTAVMQSVAVLILLGGFGSLIPVAICGGAGGEIGAFFAPAAPYTAIMYLVDPMLLFDGNKTDFASGIQSARIAAFFGCAVAVLVYGWIVMTVYKSLVRGFDMIMRKQSGT